MNTPKRRLGFYDKDGSLEQHLEWGFDISFVYENKKYKFEWYENNDICKRCLYGYNEDGTRTKPLILAEDDDIEKLLATPFLGETLRDIIDKSEIVGYA